MNDTPFFVQGDHLSRRIFDNGMHFIHCHASEVVWSWLKSHTTVKWSQVRSNVIKSTTVDLGSF